MNEKDLPVAYVLHPKLYRYIDYYFNDVEPASHLQKTPLRLIFGINFYEDPNLTDSSDVPAYKAFYNEAELNEYYIPASSSSAKL